MRSVTWGRIVAWDGIVARDGVESRRPVIRLSPWREDHCPSPGRPTASARSRLTLTGLSESTRPVALVTGGGIRLGRALALGLASHGYDLAVSHNRSAEGAAGVAELARQQGVRVRTVRADLSSESGAARVAEAVRDTFGRLDLLVNSAASFVSDDLLLVSGKEWDDVMAVNLKAPFVLVRETAGLLRAARGSIVNIVDLSALHPWTSHPHHSVAKAGLLHLTRVMARRLAPLVRANAIAPGHVLPPEDLKVEEIERLRRRAPLHRTGSPDDVLAAALFLAHASYLTGQVLVVDGGESLVINQAEPETVHGSG